MKTKSMLIWKIRLAFGSAILTFLVVGAISHRGMVVSSESDRLVRHTHEVLETLQDSLSASQSTESSSRGFALTASDEYVDSFHAGILRVQQDETFLRNLTVDNPVQQRQFPILDILVNHKIKFGERIIDLRRTMGLTAAAGG